MKSIFTFILTMFIMNSLLGQDIKTIVLHNTVSHNPIPGVMVFSDGNFLAVSDDKGTCRINDTITEIYCKYLGYKGKTLDIRDCDTCIFILESNYNLLEEVEVKGKYNAKKQLLKLLKESQQTAYKFDTNIYYKFKEINRIPELNQTEIFTGILRVENKGYSKKGNLIFISEISNYYNTIEQDIYKENRLNKILEKFILDVLYPRNIRSLRRKNHFQGSAHNTRDSLTFRVFTKRNEISTDADYILFIKNKLRTREVAKTFYRDTVDLKYYIKTDYSLPPITIPEHILASREYILENGQLVTNTIELQKIDNPHIEPELNIYLYSSTCKELVEKAKEKYPDLNISSEEDNK
ncbi:MAG: hypothetical protein U9N51_01860 [Bacteroidota bacterium]|nr:hypothetical protein [Bacteroidota bacterium]